MSTKLIPLSSVILDTLQKRTLLEKNSLDIIQTEQFSQKRQLKL